MILSGSSSWDYLVIIDNTLTNLLHLTEIENKNVHDRLAGIFIGVCTITMSLVKHNLIIIIFLKP